MIILASQSPRRRAILDSLGVNYEVIVPNCEEVTSEILPKKIVMDLSLQKAKNVSSRIKDASFIIAADTIVCLNEDILGKPKSENEAYQMLKRLQGN